MNKIKKYNFNKKGGNLSNRPYLLEISKFKLNEILLKKENEDDEYSRGLKYTEKLSPLSGSELKYDPDLWNKDESIKNSHNCYTYALGKIVKKLKSKAQPGYASGYDHIDDEYKCEDFRERLKNDSPGSYLEKFDNKCLPGFYKVFLALDPGQDYHWWRQNSYNENDLNKGTWSHKPGSTDVVNVDAGGEPIYNPLKANRNYNSLNYSKPCFFACIYSDLTRSIDEIYKK